MFCYKLIPRQTIVIDSGRRVEVGEILLVRTSYIFEIYSKENRIYFDRPMLIEISKDTLNEKDFELCSPSQYDKILLQDKINMNGSVRIRKKKGSL